MALSIVVFGCLCLWWSLEALSSTEELAHRPFMWWIRKQKEQPGSQAELEPSKDWPCDLLQQASSTNPQTAPPALG